MKHRYYDATGREVDVTQATNRDGSLRDTFRMRVPTTFRDVMQGRDASRRKPDKTGQAPGDICTIDGREGRLVTVSGQLQCVALQSSDSLVTDGHGNSGLNLQRPGFRLSTGDSRQQQVVDAAYTNYERQLCNRYKLHDGEQLCGRCGGEGFLNGEECSRCQGSGVVDEDDFDTDDTKGKSLFGSGNGHGRSDDGRSTDQTMRDHQQNMARLYADHDRELAEAWRKR
jgi:hypothetical protein